MKKFLPLLIPVFFFVGCQPSGEYIEYGASNIENGLTLKGSSGTVVVPYVREIDLGSGTLTNNGSGSVEISVSGGAGSDTTAIHDNIDGEINAIALKATPDSSDVVLLEDSADGYSKKKTTVSALATASGVTAFIDLTDTPASYSGESGNCTAVNGTEDGLEFVTCGSGGGAPTDATYITQTSNGTLSAEQAMGDLATGIVKNTTTTGVQSIAVAGTDYVIPSGNVATSTALAANGTNCSAGEAPLGVDASGNSEGCFAVLTSESDTLDDVTGRGASTTNAITTGNITIGDGSAVDYTLSFDASANDGAFTFDESEDDLIWDSNLVINGDLTTNGTNTELYSTNVYVEDKLITLGNNGAPDDTTADGGGVVLKGADDINWLWANATDSWTTGEGIITTANITGVNYKSSGYLDFDEISAPANPSADDGRLYVADNGGTTTLYFKDSAGTATDLLAGGSGTPGGSDTEVQYNNSGSFDGITNFTTDGTNITTARFEANVGIGTAGVSNYDLILGGDHTASVVRGLQVITNQSGTTGGASTGIDVLNTLDGSLNFDHTVGVQVRPDFQGTGTLTNMYGIHTKPQNTNASGTVTNMYGVYLNNPDINGTVTNNYGLYIEELTGGTNKTPFYIEAGNSYLGDKVSLGDDSFLKTESIRVAQSVVASPPTTYIYNNATMILESNGGPFLSFVSGNADGISGIQFTAGGSTTTAELRYNDTAKAFIVNEQGYNVDLRIESDTNANMFFLDAGNSYLGIANGSPIQRLDVSGAIRIQSGNGICDSTTEGTVEYSKSASTRIFRVCFQDNTSSYNWKVIHSESW